MTNPQKLSQEAHAISPPKIGLALGSGAARGWAHIGVLQALDELEMKPDVMTGCSVGALVGGAHLMGLLPDLEKWARELGPLGALKEFSFSFSKGGLINPESAFEVFRDADQMIEDLSIPFGANATDISTGAEVHFTTGSVIDAARASSAIPMIFNAAKMPGADGDRWLLDGALANPVPITLARSLGADRIIAVDLNSMSRTLDRFSPSTSRAVTVREEQQLPSSKVLPDRFATLLANTKTYVEDQVALARSRRQAAPRFMETIIATADIIQANLGDARALIDRPDVRLRPDLRDYSHAAFHEPDAIIEIGYETTMAAKSDILALKGQRAEKV